MTGAISSASFNGVNLLNGSQTGTLSFVSGYDATASGGTVSTIGFSASALVGGTPSDGAASTTPAAVVTNTALISQLESATSGTTTWDSASAVAGTSQVTVNGGSVTVLTTAPDGATTTSTYQAYSDYATSTSATNTSALSANNLNGASTWTVKTTTTAGTTPTSTGLLIQNGTSLLGGTYDLTALGNGPNETQVSSANANDMLSAVAAALSAVTTYAATIGSTQVAMTAASTFNAALSTDYANGISALVDADMNTASTRLQALQTQEQLGIQSLSIANQNSQLILKLFNG